MKEKIDLVIIIPPAGIKNTVYPPYGAMYIASALRQKGYNTQIVNVDTERISNSELVKRIHQIAPRYIGFSGIVAPSYKFLKELSFELRKNFPDKIQILGGGLSSAAEPVLNNSAIDIVVRGEGDATITELIEALDKKEDLHAVKGIHFKDGDKIIFTGERRLIFPMDILPYPAFDLIDMDRYLPDGIEFIKIFLSKIQDKKILDRKRKRRMITIPTSRGCFGRCSFCFRAYPGIRVHSMKYVFDLMEYCIDKFDVGFFTLGDECFAPNKARNWEFIEEYKKRKMDVIFRILGMRVDTVDRDILRAYKEIGCWMIEYGFESGSQKMLNIINKGVTVEQNREVALMTHQAGIFTSPALILGMPGETKETIAETLSFIKSLNFDYKIYQWKYPIAIPGSPLYDYAKLTGAITDEDAYLDSLSSLGASEGASFHINVTEQPDEVVAGWDSLLKKEVDEHYLKTKYKNSLFGKFMCFLELLYLHLRRKTLIPAVREKAKIIFESFLGQGKAKAHPKEWILPKYKKQQDINIEDFLRGIDCSQPTSAAALRNINTRMRNQFKHEIEEQQKATQ